jgi:hypothetical protein
VAAAVKRHPPRLVNVRLREREGIPQKLQSRLGVFRDDHFHDIKPKEDVGIAEQAQPGKTAPRDSLPFVPVDGIEGSAKIFPRSGFDLHENQGVAIAADKVDLPTGATSKITRQNFVTVPAEKFAG